MMTSAKLLTSANNLLQNTINGLMAVKLTQPKSECEVNNFLQNHILL